ncbi:MAG: tetratricopeptide repeat protein, partial [Planctomycetota bacterium]|nr:tetratricopeptide repeat protein [Planctomycetota bacterium]
MGQLFVAQLRRSKFDDARKWAMEIVKVEPESGYNALGELGMTLRDAPAAIEAFTKVLATNKQAKGVLVNRGRCYLTQDKFDLAEKDFQAAWNLDNRYLEAAIGLAKANAGKKDTLAASKWVQTAIDLPEGIRDKWIRDMSMISWEARKETTVQNLIQRREAIIAVDPKDADNRLLLGELYLRANETEKAEAQYTFVYANSPDAKVRAATKLAELYVATRRPEKAKGILNEVQRLATDRVGALLAYAGYILQTEGATPECHKMI